MTPLRPRLFTGAPCAIRHLGHRLGYTLLLAVLLGFATGNVWAQNRLKRDRDAYRDKYKDMAIEQMRLHGVPASITLAQGMLESGNGNSSLATKGNNHFGIKCHKGWEGRRMYHDDDARGECFRVYSSAAHSFEDHSLFLRGTRRYAFLFDLDPTDYKGWAHGLQKAGYATDPRYATRLIAIIEEEQLMAYDKGTPVEVASPTVDQGRKLADDSSFEIKMGGAHPIYVRNRVKYIVVEPHDTYASLTRALEMLPWELQRYNELPERTLPPPGTELYIQPKRWRAAIEHSVHVVEPGETLYSIAQQYAVKTKRLARRNRLSINEPLEPGQLIYLRGRPPKK